MAADGLMDGLGIPAMTDEGAMVYGWKSLHDAYQQARDVGD